MSKYSKALNTPLFSPAYFSDEIEKDFMAMDAEVVRYKWWDNLQEFLMNVRNCCTHEETILTYRKVLNFLETKINLNLTIPVEYIKWSLQYLEDTAESEIDQHWVHTLDHVESISQKIPESVGGFLYLSFLVRLNLQKARRACIVEHDSEQTKKFLRSAGTFAWTGNNDDLKKLVLTAYSSFGIPKPLHYVLNE